MPVTDTPLRYPGGKSQMTSMIVDLLRENDLFDGVYVEPFAGGCGIAWTLLLNGYVSEIWINDIDPAIHAFWLSVLNSSDKLCAMIDAVIVNIDEWHLQRSVQTARSSTPLALGFSTLFLNRTNRSGILKAGVIGGKDQRGKYLIDCRFNKTDLIRKIQRIAKYADRVRLSKLDAGVFLTSLDATLPERALINIDPPYYAEGPNLYCNFYTHEDHVALSKTISHIKHQWILTYDDRPEIRKIYRRRRVAELQLQYSAQVKRLGVELLYASPRLRSPMLLAA